MVWGWVEKAFAKVCGLGTSVLDVALMAALQQAGVEAHPDDDGCQLEDVYELDRKGKLGAGMFATVRLLRHRATGERLAVKTLKLTMHIDGAGNVVGANLLALQSELYGLCAGRGHPNVLLLRAVHETKVALHLVTEICSGGDLLQMLLQLRPNGLDDGALSSLGWHLLGALAHLHGAPRHLAHRDVKLENIMFAHPHAVEQLKLIDFGSCASFASDPREDACPFTETDGTRFYASPEKLARCYGAKADIWAAGVVLYVAAAGVRADGRADTPAAELMRQGDLGSLLQQPRHGHFSDGLRAALEALLAVEVPCRPSAERAQEQIGWLSQRPPLPPARPPPPHFEPAVAPPPYEPSTQSASGAAGPAAGAPTPAPEERNRV